MRNLAALTLSAMLLAGCVTASSNFVCPTLVEYSKEDQARAADELDKLPAGSVIGRFVADYGRLRAQVRVCRN